MERVPYPSTRMELAVCILCERVSWHALAPMAIRPAGSSQQSRARACPSCAIGGARGLRLATEFAADETNRPLAQQLVNRWLVITLLSLGRPDSSGDARALQLKHCTPRGSRASCASTSTGSPRSSPSVGLVMPDVATLGLELPATAKSVARWAHEHDLEPDGRAHARRV